MQGLVRRARHPVRQRVSLLHLVAGMLAGALLTPVPAGGAIIIDSTYAAGSPGGAVGSYTIDAATQTANGFDPSSSDKLVVVIGSRRDRGATHWINGLTYGGAAMAEAVQQRSGNTVEETTGIYYLDSPGGLALGNLVVNLNAKAWNPDSGFSMLSLSGTDPGVVSANGSIGVSTNLNTLVNNTIVIAGSENLTSQGTPAPQAPLISLGGQDLGSGYQFVPTAGIVTPTFGATGATTVAAAFAAAAGGPPPPPTPVSLLSTDFTGRTVTGSTASNIPWVSNGIADPGALTAVPVGGGTWGGLFDTANAQGHFAPDRNTGNEGPWSVDIPIDLTVPEVELQDLVLDWQHFTNSGAFQGPSRSVDWTATVTGSLSGVIGSVTALNVGGTSGIETLSFTTPLMLTAGESWILQILAEGSNTTGNNTGLDAINLIGLLSEPAGFVIPEPSTATLLGLAMLCLAGLLRRRRA